MEEASQARLHAETETWLNAGRGRLLRTLLDLYVPSGDRGLEILEVGAGAGQHIPILGKFGVVDAAEISELAHARLESITELRTLYRDPLPDLDLPRTYDVIVAMDVLEHIEDDAAAARWIFEHLRERGVFIATVPAYQWMYSDHDRVNMHFRRYRVRRLLEILPDEFNVLARGYFNTTLFPAAVMGRLAWQFKNRRKASPMIKQSSSMPGAIDRLFSWILGAEAALIKGGIRPPFGLSAFCVAKRQ